MNKLFSMYNIYYDFDKFDFPTHGCCLYTAAAYIYTIRKLLKYSTKPNNLDDCYETLRSFPVIRKRVNTPTISYIIS